MLKQFKIPLSIEKRIPQSITGNLAYAKEMQDRKVMMERNEDFSIVIPALNEEKHIEGLIRSIHEQDYRPTEVVVIDDGSKDETIEMVRKLINELNDSNFTIILLETRNFGSLRGPAFARNIGVQNSHGKYILFIDADCLLTRKNIVNELVNSLESYPITGYKDVVLVDNWLECNQMLDEGDPPYATKAKWSHLAFRREIIEKITFDPQLGVGEDADFLQKIRNLGSLNPKIIDISGHIHLTHTFNEYKLQRFWAGRTRWLFLRKYPSLGGVLSTLVRATPCGILILAAILALMNFWIGMILLIPWIILVVYFFIRSPVKSLSRIAYLVFRFTYGSFWYTCGLLKGFYDLYIRGVVNPSRGR